MKTKPCGGDSLKVGGMYFCQYGLLMQIRWSIDTDRQNYQYTIINRHITLYVICKVTVSYRYVNHF